MSQDNDNGFGKTFHFLAFHILLFTNSCSCTKNYVVSGYQINHNICCDKRKFPSKLYWSFKMIEHALFPIHDVLWYAKMDKNKVWENLKLTFLIKKFEPARFGIHVQVDYSSNFYFIWVGFDLASQLKNIGRPFLFFLLHVYGSVLDSKGRK